MTPATIRSTKGANDANWFTGKPISLSQFLHHNKAKFSTILTEFIARSHTKFKRLDLTINKRGVKLNLFTSQTPSNDPCVTSATERFPMSKLHRLYWSGNSFNELRMRSKLEFVIRKTGHISDSICFLSQQLLLSLWSYLCNLNQLYCL